MSLGSGGSSHTTLYGFLDLILLSLRKRDRRPLNVLAIVNVWSLVSIRAGALILITIAALGSTLPSTPALKAWFRMVSELYYI